MEILLIVGRQMESGLPKIVIKRQQVLNPCFLDQQLLLLLGWLALQHKLSKCEGVGEVGHKINAVFRLAAIMGKVLYKIE